MCYLLPRGQWEWRPPVLQGAWRWRVCTRLSRLYTIHLDETRAEIHVRPSEKCLLFSLITHILESSILSSCRTCILNPRRHLRGIDDSLCCACRSKASCLKREIWLRNSFSVVHLCLWLLCSCCVLGLQHFACDIPLKLNGILGQSHLCSLWSWQWGCFSWTWMYAWLGSQFYCPSRLGSGTQGVTDNAYAMPGMIAVFIMCMAWQGEAYEFLRPVNFCCEESVIRDVCIGVSSSGS